MSSDMITVYLSLGSNLGDREANLKKAIELISNRMRTGKTSAIYETEPVGVPDQQPRYLNLAMEVFTRLAAKDLLVLTKGFEAMLGRAKNSSNAPRPIDIDILFYGNQVIRTDDLVIPHPRLTERAFVLVPMSEIAPDLIHPENSRKVSDLLKSLPSLQGVVRWESKVKEIK